MNKKNYILFIKKFCNYNKNIFNYNNIYNIILNYIYKKCFNCSNIGYPTNSKYRNLSYIKEYQLYMCLYCNYFYCKKCFQIGLGKFGMKICIKCCIKCKSCMKYYPKQFYAINSKGIYDWCQKKYTNICRECNGYTMF